MTIILLIFISIIADLIVASIKTKGNTRKISLTLLLIVLLIPLCLILLIKPSQQGKILPSWGKISLLFSEPDDLRIPLAKAALNRNLQEYVFPLSHKYVGHYNIEILFSDENIDVWKIDKNDIGMSVSFSIVKQSCSQRHHPMQAVSRDHEVADLLSSGIHYRKIYQLTES